jgi:hypothetical protein
MANVRAPAQPPLSTQRRHLQILFRHPGYDDGNNVLFKNTTHSENSIFGIQSYFRAQMVALDAN